MMEGGDGEELVCDSSNQKFGLIEGSGIEGDVDFADFEGMVVEEGEHFLGV